LKRLAGICMFFILSSLLLTCSSSPSGADAFGAKQDANAPYYTGDGGKGIKLAVLEPSGKGLGPNEQWLLPLVQGAVTAYFNKYSAMTIIDRQNLEKILAEQTQSLSLDYSDADYISIGKLTNARYILTGGISRTANAYMLELSVSDVESGERKASYPPQTVAYGAIENLQAVKDASADLLVQMGVNLSTAGIENLRKAAAPTQVQAETALARGISAQRQGTEVAALSYYFQAAALDPSLLEAASRSTVLSASITSGNIGEDIRNDIQWRKNWIARLTETEEYFDAFHKTNSRPYTLFYSTGIEQGPIDYKTETATLGVKINLHGSQIWFLSLERVLQTVYDGLTATKRKEAWGLDGWPLQGVTGLKPFEKQSKIFTVHIEVINNQGQVIGGQSFQAGETWEIVMNERPEINASGDDLKTVDITKINANEITDSLTIKITDVDGLDALAAAQSGLLQIKAINADEFGLYRTYKGSIIEYTGKETAITIPATVWDEPVIAIDEGVFYNGKNSREPYRLTSVTIGNNITSIGKRAFCANKLTSITIPDSVTNIGDEAFCANKLTSIIIGSSITTINKETFAFNKLTSVVISDSVTYIGARAFEGNELTSVTIPNSVTYIGFNAFNYNRGLAKITIGANVYVSVSEDDFEYYYEKNGKKAGTYIRKNYITRRGDYWAFSSR
jgi:hypothetical protein